MKYLMLFELFQQTLTSVPNQNSAVQWRRILVADSRQRRGIDSVEFDGKETSPNIAKFHEFDIYMLNWFCVLHGCLLLDKLYYKTQVFFLIFIINVIFITFDDVIESRSFCIRFSATSGDVEEWDEMFFTVKTKENDMQ